MGRSPTAITTLSPCLLMSPLSVAQYLSPEVANFDIVIFDEASQIPVWDAVGAIARAKQVVMVGDPRQLPPTSFFDRAETDSEDTDVEADLESILDECIGANLPTLNLSWHYRSQHESLIAFSNHRYYEGRLVTFPSPYIEDKAVSFHHVSNGTYEKGGARTNKAEAKALVDDLVGKLNSPECRDKGLTIGVVTFIWSTDWWVDADTVVEKIHSQLTALLEKRRAERVLQSNVVSSQAKREEKVEQDNKLAKTEENPTAKQVLYAKADTINTSDVSGLYI